MQLVILGEQSVILSNQLFPLPYLLLPDYALYSDECLQSPFKILSVTAFVPSTFNSSSKFIFTKLHWLQFPKIAQFRSTVFNTLCLILNVKTHIIMTWFSFTNVHINPVLLVLTSFSLWLPFLICFCHFLYSQTMQSCWMFSIALSVFFFFLYKKKVSIAYQS